VNYTDSGMLTKDKNKDKDHGHQDRQRLQQISESKGYSSL
jgi:hypothetical protein